MASAAGVAGSRRAGRGRLTSSSIRHARTVHPKLEFGVTVTGMPALVAKGWTIRTCPRRRISFGSVQFSWVCPAHLQFKAGHTSFDATTSCALGASHRPNHPHCTARARSTAEPFNTRTRPVPLLSSDTEPCTKDYSPSRAARFEFAGDQRRPR